MDFAKLFAVILYDIWRIDNTWDIDQIRTKIEALTQQKSLRATSEAVVALKKIFQDAQTRTVFEQQLLERKQAKQSFIITPKHNPDTPPLNQLSFNLAKAIKTLSSEDLACLIINNPPMVGEIFKQIDLLENFSIAVLFELFKKFVEVKLKTSKLSWKELSARILNSDQFITDTKLLDILGFTEQDLFGCLFRFYLHAEVQTPFIQYAQSETFIGSLFIRYCNKFCGPSATPIVLKALAAARAHENSTEEYPIVNTPDQPLSQSAALFADYQDPDQGLPAIQSALKDEASRIKHENFALLASTHEFSVDQSTKNLANSYFWIPTTKNQAEAVVNHIMKADNLMTFIPFLKELLDRYSSEDYKILLDRLCQINQDDKKYNYGDRIFGFNKRIILFLTLSARSLSSTQGYKNPEFYLIEACEYAFKQPDSDNRIARVAKIIHSLYIKPNANLENFAVYIPMLEQLYFKYKTLLIKKIELFYDPDSLNSITDFLTFIYHLKFIKVPEEKLLGGEAEKFLSLQNDQHLRPVRDKLLSEHFQKIIKFYEPQNNWQAHYQLFHIYSNPLCITISNSFLLAVNLQKACFSEDFPKERRIAILEEAKKLQARISSIYYIFAIYSIEAIFSGKGLNLHSHQKCNFLKACETDKELLILLENYALIYMRKNFGVSSDTLSNIKAIADQYLKIYKDKNSYIKIINNLLELEINKEGNIYVFVLKDITEKVENDLTESEFDDFIKTATNIVKIDLRIFSKKLENDKKIIILADSLIAFNDLFDRMNIEFVEHIFELFQSLDFFGSDYFKSHEQKNYFIYMVAEIIKKGFSRDQLIKNRYASFIQSFINASKLAFYGLKPLQKNVSKLSFDELKISLEDELKPLQKIAIVEVILLIFCEELSFRISAAQPVKSNAVTHDEHAIYRNNNNVFNNDYEKLARTFVACLESDLSLKPEQLFEFNFINLTNHRVEIRSLLLMLSIICSRTIGCLENITEDQMTREHWSDVQKNALLMIQKRGKEMREVSQLKRPSVWLKYIKEANEHIKKLGYSHNLRFIPLPPLVHQCLAMVRSKQFLEKFYASTVSGVPFVLANNPDIYQLLPPGYEFLFQLSRSTTMAEITAVFKNIINVMNKLLNLYPKISNYFCYYTARILVDKTIKYGLKNIDPQLFILINQEFLKKLQSIDQEWSFPIRQLIKKYIPSDSDSKPKSILALDFNKEFNKTMENIKYWHEEKGVKKQQKLYCNMAPILFDYSFFGIDDNFSFAKQAILFLKQNFSLEIENLFLKMIDHEMVHHLVFGNKKPIVFSELYTSFCIELFKYDFCESFLEKLLTKDYVHYLQQNHQLTLITLKNFKNLDALKKIYFADKYWEDISEITDYFLGNPCLIQNNKTYLKLEEFFYYINIFKVKIKLDQKNDISSIGGEYFNSCFSIFKINKGSPLLQKMVTHEIVKEFDENKRFLIELLIKPQLLIRIKDKHFLEKILHKMSLLISPNDREQKKFNEFYHYIYRIFFVLDLKQTQVFLEKIYDYQINSNSFSLERIKIDYHSRRFNLAKDFINHLFYLSRSDSDKKSSFNSLTDYFIYLRDKKSGNGRGGRYSSYEIFYSPAPIIELLPNDQEHQLIALIDILINNAKSNEFDSHKGILLVIAHGFCKILSTCSKDPNIQQKYSNKMIALMFHVSLQIQFSQSHGLLNNGGVFVPNSSSKYFLASECKKNTKPYKATDKTQETPIISGEFFDILLRHSKQPDQYGFFNKPPLILSNLMAILNSVIKAKTGLEREAVCWIILFSVCDYYIRDQRETPTPGSLLDDLIRLKTRFTKPEAFEKHFEIPIYTIRMHCCKSLASLPFLEEDFDLWSKIEEPLIKIFDPVPLRMLW